MRLQLRYKFIVLGVFLFALGCNSSDRNIVISPMFGICLKNQSEDIGFTLNQSKPVDWDDGEIATERGSVHVYVGHHPDFPRKSKLPVQLNTENFSLVGRTEEGDQRLLYGINTAKGPIYVMLRGNRDAVTALIGRGISFSICQPQQ